MRQKSAAHIAAAALISVIACSSPGPAGPEGESIATATQALGSIEDLHLEGYADHISAAPGETVNFYVNLPPSPAGTTYYMEFVHYGSGADCGSGTRCTIVSAAANHPINSSTCPQCYGQTYSATAAVDGAGFQTPVPISIPSAPAWTSGLYAAHLCATSDCSDPLGAEGNPDPATTNHSPYIMFVVRSIAPAAPIVLVASTNTWAACNFWPYAGNPTVTSWYSVNDPCPPIPPSVNPPPIPPPSLTLSFLRPNPNAPPYYQDIFCTPVETPPTHFFLRSYHLALGNIQIAQWLDATAKAYSVISDWDLDQTPGILDPATSPTVILPTHSEYWSRAMHTALARYTAGGGNVVSLSGNTMEHLVTFAVSQQPANVTITKVTNNGLNTDVNWGPENNGGDYIDPSTGTVPLPAAQLLGTQWEEGPPGVAGVDHFCSVFTNTPQPGVTPAEAQPLASSSHWAFAGVANVTNMGSAGYQPAQSATFCSNVGNGSVLPAVGGEVDSLYQRNAYNLPVLKPGLRRMVSHLATTDLGGGQLAAGADGPADIVYMQNASAGPSLPT